MSTPTVTCSRPERHAQYAQADGSCWVCSLVAHWPAPTDEQVDVLRRCLPPLSPERLADLRRERDEHARTSSTTRRAA